MEVTPELSVAFAFEFLVAPRVERGVHGKSGGFEFSGGGPVYVSVCVFVLVGGGEGVEV